MFAKDDATPPFSSSPPCEKNNSLSPKIEKKNEPRPIARLDAPRKLTAALAVAEKRERKGCQRHVGEVFYGSRRRRRRRRQHRGRHRASKNKKRRAGGGGGENLGDACGPLARRSPRPRPGGQRRHRRRLPPSDSRREGMPPLRRGRRGGGGGGGAQRRGVRRRCRHRRCCRGPRGR